MLQRAFILFIYVICLLYVVVCVFIYLCNLFIVCVFYWLKMLCGYQINLSLHIEKWEDC